MGRYTNPVCKLCRREGQKLFLKGERCYTNKCAAEKRPYPPGEHGQTKQFRRRSVSDYALQMREKQRARRIYGVLEAQFRRYFEEAGRLSGRTGENLLAILERRFDNVLYRAGFARSRPEARQLACHGHFEVNGRKLDIPSYLVRPGDVITARDTEENRQALGLIREGGPLMQTPIWLDVTPERLVIKVIGVPARADIEVTLNEQLIVEHYSR